MTAPASLALPSFPSNHDLARALFVEAARHLEDARFLYAGSRHPAAITSSMKAAELGIKSVLALDGAMGWWEKLLATHTPLTDIETHPVLVRHKDYINISSAGLIADLKAMERLAPLKPGAGKFDVQNEANPEYPFVSIDQVVGKMTTKLDSPATYFGPIDSERYYKAAHRLLTVLGALYPIMASWSVVLPSAV